MSFSRRRFLSGGLAAGAALALYPRFGLRADAGSASLKLLVLGGTGFIGPHIVRAAMERGHEVTIFNRGKSNTELFPDIENLVGDRDGQLGALEGRSWDVVIDNSGYVPRHVRDSAQLLSAAAGHYLFTSTGGVYDAVYSGQWPENDAYTDEDAPVAALPEPGSEEVSKYYGQLKALCEEDVRRAFPGRCTITRPGLIVGPGDGTDRFTYYPARIAHGGEMLAFGSPGDPVQYIDARDLAEFSLHCVEQRIAGTFNAIGPLEPMTMGEMLNGIKAALAADVDFTWVPGDFLAEHGAAPGSLMPWINQQGPLSGIARLAPDRAFANGLAFRPFADTVRDTLAWWLSLDAERRAAMRGGLRGGLRGGALEPGPASMEQQLAREAEILAAWQAQS